MLDLFPVAKYAEDQEYSMEMLYLHGVMKGLQVGPLLGMAVGMPVAIIRKNPRIFYNNISFSTLLGPILVSGMTYITMKDQEFIGFQDRAYRLQRNRNQNLSDYCSLAGICLGAALLGPRIGFLSASGLGSASGLAAFMIGNKLDAFQNCSQPAINRCSLYHCDFYCSADCQKANWDVHKEVCGWNQEVQNIQLFTYGGGFNVHAPGTAVGDAQEMIWHLNMSDCPHRVHVAQKALKISRDCMYAHVILAKNRHDRGDNVQALKHAIDAVEAGYRIFPGAKKAKRIYYRVMENRPFLRTLNMQALCLHGLGRLDEAIHVAKKLLKLNPQDDQTIQPFLVSWAVQ